MVIISGKESKIELSFLIILTNTKQIINTIGKQRKSVK